MHVYAILVQQLQSLTMRMLSTGDAILGGLIGVIAPEEKCFVKEIKVHAEWAWHPDRRLKMPWSLIWATSQTQSRTS